MDIQDPSPARRRRPKRFEDEYTHFRVCREHGNLYEETPDADGNRQVCHEPTEGPWEHHDLSKKRALCSACLQELIPDGSRWSSFSCTWCRPRLLERRASSALVRTIPLGRHSIMNGIGLSPGAASWPSELRRFEDAVSSLVGRLDLLAESRLDRLAPVLDEFDHDPWVGQVIAEVARRWTRAQGRRDLESWWAAKTT